MADLQRDPVMNVIHDGIRRSINVLLESECYGAAAVLILSAIDTMAFLSMPKNQQDVTKSDFISWAAKYIRFPGKEQLSGADLYGARCAMLHSYGLSSRMSRSGECRMIGYMDQSYPPIRYSPKVSKELVLVSLPALRDALFQGIDSFLIDIYKEPKSERATLVDERFTTLVHKLPAKEIPES